MADKDKNKKLKLKARRTKHKSSSIDEWDSYNTKDKKERKDKRKEREKKKDKKKDKKHHSNDKKKDKTDEEKDKTDTTKQFRRPKSMRNDKDKDKKLKAKRRDSKLKKATPKSENGDGFGTIKNKSKNASKRKDKRDSGFGNLIQSEKKFVFDDNADLGQSNINFTPKESSKRRRKKSTSEQTAEAKNTKNMEDIEREKEKMQQERLRKLKEIRASKAVEKQREADKLKKKGRKRGQSKGHKHDAGKEATPEKKADVDEKEETGEERKARKQREKQQRLERLKNLRMQHEDQKKKTQKELEQFLRKRDNKRYTFAYNAYPKDAQKAKQTVYKSLRRLKELCPIISFQYDPNNKNVEPILNPYGLSVTHMDCLVAYYMVDTEWNGVITKVEYVNCIKTLLKITEWNDAKIDIVWNNLLMSKSITKQIYDEYVSDMKQTDEKKADLDNDPVYNYKGYAHTAGVTIIDFINGLNLCRNKDIEKRNSAVYDFYYLLLGGHFYDDSLAEEDDWHGDFTQRVLWLKQFGEKAEYLYTIDHGNSFVGACHGLQEYRAIICSLLNVDFIPPSDKHSGEIISKFKDLISDTVGKIKLFQYEWFQGEVLIGAAKICILRSDIMYSSMKPINIILKECDRLLTMLESKVLVQSAMHLMKTVVIQCPTKQQDLLLKELSALISGSHYKHRSFVPLQQLLLLLLVAIDRYNIQNSKTWQRIAAVPVFACSHEKQEIADLGEEVLWRIYTFSPSVGEDILSNKMEKKKAKHVRKALGIEKYWEQQQLKKAGMKTIKIYQEYDPIPNNWKKLTYNPALNEMSPARVWTMMQKVIQPDIDLLDEHPSMNYDDFVKGLSECQSYLRASSVRALFQCLPRKHRPFVTKQEFIDFICMSHVAPNRRHYSLRIKELLTIVEDKWKTDELEKKRVVQQKAIEREQQRLKRKQERAEKKRLNEEKRRKQALARKEREQQRKEQALAKQEEEREAKLVKQQEEKRKEDEEKKKLEAEEKKKLDAEKKKLDAEKKRLKKLGKEQRRKERKEERRKRKEAKKKKKANAPQLDTSMDALQENEEQEVVRQQTPQNTNRKTEHSKTKTREEEVWEDMVALLDFGDDIKEDAAGYDFKLDKSRGSDEDSEPSLSYAGQPKTPYYGGGKRSSVTSINSALNTPTFAEFGNKSITGFSPSRHGYKSSWNMDATDLDSVIGDNMVPIIKDDEVPNVLDDDSNDDEDGKVNTLKQLCGISIRRILKLNRDDVYEMRSVILFHEGELSAAFKKKMGREFCLNAAATKLLFVAGLQDRGCSLDNEQLNIVHYGVEQFLSETEYDLPSAVAKWVVHDETSEDKTSRLQRDDDEWNRVKKSLPTFLKHEVIAFIFGETYFGLTDIDANDEKKAKRKRRKKGEPVIHRNTNYIASCVKELHDVNLPKKKYTELIWGYLHELNITNESDVNTSLVFCVSFYMPLSEKPADESGDLEVKSLILDKTWHPQKMNAAQGFNEYDNIRVRRTGRMTTIPFDNDTGNGGVLLLKVYGELFIERHATLDADSCGYSGGWTYQCQGDSVGKCGRTSRYCNFGGGGGGYYAGGGGYGSRGSTPKSDFPSILKCGEGGRYYGDRFVHLSAYMGSGGGSGGGKYLYSRGGRGGGIVIVIAGSIHNKGRIMSLGQRGKYLAGSGSGGSIVIECNSYYHYGKGAILASSLEAYPDGNKKHGGIGGCGRVAMKINRQKWTSVMRKAICTNNIQQIWSPAAWIYPIPKWCAPDAMNRKPHLSPKLIGFHVISRIEDSVYKNCTSFRNDIADGPLINNFSKVGQIEFKDFQTYKKRKEKERKTLYEWKFDEFALEKEESYDKHHHKPKLQKRKSEYIAYRSSAKLVKT